MGNDFIYNRKLDTEPKTMLRETMFSLQPAPQWWRALSCELQKICHTLQSYEKEKTSLLCLQLSTQVFFGYQAS